MINPLDLNLKYKGEEGAKTIKEYLNLTEEKINELIDNTFSLDSQFLGYMNIDGIKKEVYRKRIVSLMPTVATDKKIVWKNVDVVSNCNKAFVEWSFIKNSYSFMPAHHYCLSTDPTLFCKAYIQSINGIVQLVLQSNCTTFNELPIEASIIYIK